LRALAHVAAPDAEQACRGVLNLLLDRGGRCVASVGGGWSAGLLHSVRTVEDGVMPRTGHLR